MHVVIAWELGSNWGHLSVGLALAARLKTADHKVTFVVNELKLAKELLDPVGFNYLLSPSQRYKSRLADISNYAELLIAQGYAEPEMLGSKVDGWIQLLSRLAPDLVVAMHAPTALIAAQILNVRSVVVGAGFTIPPAISPFPSFKPWQHIANERLRTAEQAVLFSLNSMRGKYAKKPIKSLASIFNTRQLLTTLPELDHYPPTLRAKDHQYVGSLSGMPLPDRCSWQTNSKNKIYVYLRPWVPLYKVMLECLSSLATSFEVVCCIPGVSDEDRDRFSSKNMRIFPHALNTKTLLSAACMVVGYGGAGSIVSAALAGVPQLIIPATVEQYLGGLKVEAAGLGKPLAPTASSQQVGRAMIQLAESVEVKSNVMRFSAKYQHMDFTLDMLDSNLAASSHS